MDEFKEIKEEELIIVADPSHQSSTLITESPHTFTSTPDTSTPDNVVSNSNNLALEALEALEDNQPWYYSILHKENRSLLIHTVSDFILFYLFFSYTHNQFNITHQLIKTTRERVNELKNKI